VQPGVRSRAPATSASRDDLNTSSRGCRSAACAAPASSWPAATVSPASALARRARAATTSPYVEHRPPMQPKSRLGTRYKRLGPASAASCLASPFSEWPVVTRPTGESQSSVSLQPVNGLIPHERRRSEFKTGRTLICVFSVSGMPASDGCDGIFRRLRSYSNRAPTAVAQPVPIRLSLTSRILIAERDANSSPLAPSSNAAMTFTDPSKTPLAL
jgi:hypothetical protein